MDTPDAPDPGSHLVALDPAIHHSDGLVHSNAVNTLTIDYFDLYSLHIVGKDLHTPRWHIHEHMAAHFRGR